MVLRVPLAILICGKRPWANQTLIGPFLQFGEWAHGCSHVEVLAVMLVVITMHSRYAGYLKRHLQKNI